jgi:hypothetical protein
MSDFDFSNSGDQSKKIDYKKVFFSPAEGVNMLRIVDLKGKSFKVHYVKDVSGKKVFVKSPGAGDPLIADGQKPRTRYYLKVIDRASGQLKVWEFGSQIRTAVEEFINDLKAKRDKGTTDANDILTNYDLSLRKRKPGTNPLYTLSISERLSEDVLKDDDKVIATDEIEFEPLLKPWSIERIKEQILGIGGSGGRGRSNDDSSDDGDSDDAEPAPAPAQRQAATAVAPRPAATAGKPVVKADTSWLDKDDND